MNTANRSDEFARPRRRIAAVFRQLGCVGAVFLTLAAGATDQFEPLGNIARVAEETVTGRLPATAHSREVRAQAIDSRLRLHACPEPLQGQLAAGFSRSRRITVEVHCRAGRPWKIFVPVTVHEKQEVLVAAASLPRGTVLTGADVVVAVRSLHGLERGYLRAGQPVAGMRLRRGVSAGQVLTPSLVEARSVIHRGQQVTLVAAGGGLKVAAEGVALADGAVGQRIKVRNMSSQRELEGVVRSAQQVEVLLR